MELKEELLKFDPGHHTCAFENNDFGTWDTAQLG